jgi:hypothetical protein
MKFLICLIGALILSLPAAARDLPTAQYALIGTALPGIQQGEIIPVFVHVDIQGGRMDWTFV